MKAPIRMEFTPPMALSLVKWGWFIAKFTVENWEVSGSLEAAQSKTMSPAENFTKLPAKLWNCHNKIGNVGDGFEQNPKLNFTDMSEIIYIYMYVYVCMYITAIDS